MALYFASAELTKTHSLRLVLFGDFAYWELRVNIVVQLIQSRQLFTFSIRCIFHKANVLYVLYIHWYVIECSLYNIY